LAAAVATAAGVLVTSAACRGPGEDANAFQWTGQLPAGATVHLRTGVGSIVVRRVAGNSVTVNGSRHWTKSRAGDVKFLMNQIGNDYYVCAMWRNSGKCGGGTYRGRQTGGFLTMFSLFHRGSDAVADLVADLPAGIVIDAKTTSGSVSIDGATAGVTGLSSNGTVRASNVSGPIVLTTQNGDVSLSSDTLADTDSIRLSTSNGSIHAMLPATLQGTFDLSTVNGVVQSDFPLPQAPKARIGRHLVGQIGGSARSVKMRSVNGMVSVVGRATPATR
jgi:hypothetical protein